MFPRFFGCLLLALIVFPQATMGTPTSARSGAILVKFRTASTADPRAALPAGITIEEQLAPDTFALRVPPGEEQHYVDQMETLDSVVYAQRDHAVSPQVQPNDPEYGEQWHLPRIRMPRAWQTITNASSVTIALIDTGVKETHADLQSALWTNSDEIAGNNRDDDGNGHVDDVHGWHFYHTYANGQAFARDDEVLTDPNGHGTHVAGIVGAAGNNGVGVSGVAWHARLMIVRVLDDDASGLESDVVRGMHYAIANGADVINMSLGLAEAGPALRDMVALAEQRGVVIVAAAGNNGGNVLYPAAYPTVLSVGASDRNDERASFSSKGVRLDLVAPGVDILSTWNGVPYFMLSGTSMAAPQVTGVAALFLVRHPTATPAQVRLCLTRTATDLGTAGRDDTTGWGLLQAAHAVQGCAPPVYLPFIHAQ